MKILLGTTNPSKKKFFEDLFKDKNLEFITLKDLNITDEPIEKGNNPEENARIKTSFYGKYADCVLCNDSGLYFIDLPFTDSRQPGLKIRTPLNNKRLNDEEMIQYYSQLIHSLGGKVQAYYLNGFSLYVKGKTYSYLEKMEDVKCRIFYMIDKPTKIRVPGWPLDSLSVTEDNQYYLESQQNKIQNNEYDKQEQKMKNQLIRFVLNNIDI